MTWEEIYRMTCEVAFGYMIVDMAWKIGAIACAVMRGRNA